MNEAIEAEIREASAEMLRVMCCPGCDQECEKKVWVSTHEERLVPVYLICRFYCTTCQKTVKKYAKALKATVDQARAYILSQPVPGPPDAPRPKKRRDFA